MLSHFFLGHLLFTLQTTSDIYCSFSSFPTSLGQPQLQPWHLHARICSVYTSLCWSVTHTGEGYIKLSRKAWSYLTLELFLQRNASHIWFQIAKYPQIQYSYCICYLLCDIWQAWVSPVTHCKVTPPKNYSHFSFSWRNPVVVVSDKQLSVKSYHLPGRSRWSSMYSFFSCSSLEPSVFVWLCWPLTRWQCSTCQGQLRHCCDPFCNFCK